MKKYLIASVLCAASYSANSTIIEMQTNQGTITVNLFDQHTPITVENFLNYVEEGTYNSSVIHRSVENFVLQGGGFKFDSDFKAIETNDAIKNEPKLSNVKGTIAMAKQGGNANSATSQWFFNLKDNSANLDLQNGGFTVFGQITAESQMVLDKITELTHCGDIPVVGLNNDQCPTDTSGFNGENLVTINSVVILDDDPNSSQLLKPKENTLIKQDKPSGDLDSGSGGSMAWMLSLLALFGFCRRK
ncbi:peptidylprolyl isomerase [Pseudoalteromonas sp. SSMSWG5]|jgi:cyclophilin family peptidyl-prolyl cis-trans isomerase|uniref:peptidylprolyl isomerase n=1 Tax=Pseudoalteromonas TaxID=53246 RepID=UPI000C625184|nr:MULTISPECIES: peptidylprolyl isomerase [unclassified Pseudoalteromonas]MBD56110.1 peptidylprolyl isomerase [Pseudoalteromonas sp.]MBU76977.1 peptidylprolyl isomerase [Pseudoalteromonadaceae bacterium]MCF2899116.1 peptidylprolyl isomerase [Pseudoalteromonas sp. OFAV1]MCF2920876.1 peptidylprolyl isomerase [Pseudoalteromonas sp. APAL1]MCO7250211.1 peptidylprolyl isomerase [Pseudoalteromonas sp. Ps84H-4]|tara:strand:- start:4927 stop:5664 length:738 start_codon:yes stop_codon:yes gene_type:complete